MKEKENSKINLIVDENANESESNHQVPQMSWERLKKPLIMVLMGIVFLGCLYLIFAPSDKGEDNTSGINGAVPQAKDADLQDDKQKAYEQQLMEDKQAKERQSLSVLSDYFNTDSTLPPNTLDSKSSNPFDDSQSQNNPALNSYRNAQQTLGSFYDNGESYQTQELRKEIQDLKRELADQAQAQPAGGIDNQLALMEKSYEMAAKFLPIGNQKGQNAFPQDSSALVSNNEKEHFMAVYPIGNNKVSSLRRNVSDSSLLSNFSNELNTRFFGLGENKESVQPRNSIKAVVHQTVVVTGDNAVRLKLIEPVRTSHRTIPKGTLLSANAKIQGARMQLKISSIEYQGNILPVDILVYDLDGQQGLNIPYAPEANAVSEIASNMSQSSGTSIMMSRSAGQQITGDLSRGLVQGVSGYFSRKLRTVKVTLKEGHQVFLVSKN